MPFALNECSGNPVNLQIVLNLLDSGNSTNGFLSHLLFEVRGNVAGKLDPFSHPFEPGSLNDSGAG